VQRKYFQIDQPLIEADIINVIINTSGVLSLQGLTFFSRNGTVSGNVYSDYVFDLEANKYKGLIVPPSGAIFEVKFPSSDILGSAE
jgi:sporulation protein YlmC with PRC-barrel domain